MTNILGGVLQILESSRATLETCKFEEGEIFASNVARVEVVTRWRTF